MVLKEWNPASSILLYHRAMESRTSCLIVFLEKFILSDWHSE